MDDAAAGGGEEKAMKVARATSGMVGGAGEFSYTRSSSAQSQAISFLEPILEQEIMELELFKDWNGSTIRMADFGCSVGANTLAYAEICYRSVCQARLSNERTFPDELQYFFCDLPSNDFNTLFLHLEDWRKEQTSMEDFYATAVAGSFHRRLFPKGSLHVVISTLAVHWMSQVPDAVLDKSSTAYNKGRVWIDNNKNVAIVQAFKQAARQDLCNFLLSRADEVIPGIIEEERRDTFNIPIYCHNMEDVKVVVESTNAFHIKRCEIKRHDSLAPIGEREKILVDPKAYGQFTKNFTRNVMNSIMVEHIGEEKCHKFFECYERNVAIAAQEKKMSNLPVDCIIGLLIRK